MSDSPWQPPSAGGPPPSPVPPLAAPTARDQAPVEIEPAPPPRRRSRGVLVGAVVGVVAIGAAGVFAVQQFAAGDEGGAASPEELGQDLVDALASEDVLGLVDLMLPGERDALREPLVELVDDLSRLGVLSEDASLSGVDGIDIEVAGATVEVTPTNADDIANLLVDGAVSITVDGEALPIGDLVRDRLSGNGGDADETLAGADSSDAGSLALPVTAVQDDGRWYLSLGFTIAEAARNSSFDPPDIPDDGITPVGGDTPEDALDNLLDGVEALDVEALIAALNPGEAAALQRYAPVFLGEAEAALSDAPLDWRITEAEYTVEGGGDRRHATVDLIAIEGQLDGDDFTLEIEGGCARMSVPSQELEVDSCALNDEQSTQIDDVMGDAPAVERLLDAVETAFADAELQGFTLVRTDGAWYVSPVGTLLDALLAATGALERDELDAIIDAFPDAVAELESGLFGSGDVLEDSGLDDVIDDTIGDDTSGDDTSGDDTSGDDDIPDDTDVTFPEDDSEDAAESPSDECYRASTGTEASDCFLALLAAGQVEDWEVPIELRFPECGVADLYWAGYSSLGDEEFFAAVDPARDCFLEQAAANDLEEFELPYWVNKRECFEDRNWYGTFGDSEYDDRFFECVSS